MVAAWPRVLLYRREFIAENILGRRLFIVNCPAGVQHVFVTNSRNYRKSRSNSATLTPLSWAAASSSATASSGTASARS